MDFAELAQVAERFPAIAARIVSVANSAWSSPVNEITCLEQACARLGFNVVRSMAIALVVSAPFDASACPAFSPEKFWGSALLCADCAEWLTPLFGQRADIDQQTARTGGLLHNLGLLLLADRLPEQTHAALVAAADDIEYASVQWTREHCDIAYSEAGGRLAEVWELPGQLVDAMYHRLDARDHGERWLRQSPVGLAVVLVSAVYRGMQELPDSIKQEQLLVEKESLQAVFERCQSRAPRLRELAKALM